MHIFHIFVEVLGPERGRKRGVLCNSQYGDSTLKWQAPVAAESVRLWWERSLSNCFASDFKREFLHLCPCWTSFHNPLYITLNNLKWLEKRLFQEANLFRGEMKTSKVATQKCRRFRAKASISWPKIPVTDTLYGEARCRVARPYFSPKLSNKLIPLNLPKLESKVLGWLFVLNRQIHNKLSDINKLHQHCFTLSVSRSFIRCSGTVSLRTLVFYWLPMEDAGIRDTPYISPKGWGF